MFPSRFLCVAIRWFCFCFLLLREYTSWLPSPKTFHTLNCPRSIQDPLHSSAQTVVLRGTTGSKALCRVRLSFLTQQDPLSSGHPPAPVKLPAMDALKHFQLDVCCKERLELHIGRGTGSHFHPGLGGEPHSCSCPCQITLGYFEHKQNA